MLTRNDIRIRDPFILTDKARDCYYMYGTTDLAPDSLRAGATFSVYRTKDLEHFDEGRVVFDGHASGFPATEDFWAPEVHILNGRYYLFGSAKGEGLCRATYIFVSDTPEGPFTPVSTTPPTPTDWECLDGTLFVEGGTPYMVFCHEWIQVGDGEMCAIPLSPDLSHAIGEPFTLFRATDHPQVCCVAGRPDGFVTDGPFLFRDGKGLRMIWSSFSDGRYAVLEASADTLRGPWTHHAPRFPFDGGHAMLFETLDGVRMISLHAPNVAGAERAVFLPFPEGGDAPKSKKTNKAL